jgi:hypothetical protein
VYQPVNALLLMLEDTRITVFFEYSQKMTIADIERFRNARNVGDGLPRLGQTQEMRDAFPQ